MRKYLACALTIAVAIGPASALDAGLGGNVGGVGVSAGLGVGSNGASVGVGASVGGIGGANVGGSVGTGSLGANVGASTNLGGVSGGVSTGLGAPSGTTSGGTALGGTTGPASVEAGKKTAALVMNKGAQHAIVLPRNLRPSKNGRDMFGRATTGYPMLRLQVPLTAIPGTPPAVVRVCRQAIMSAATPLGALRVHVVSAGPLRRHRRGALTAPIEVRIDYARQGGIEVRQARVGCRLDAAGKVVAVK